jgi:hypothetical protein
MEVPLKPLENRRLDPNMIIAVEDRGGIWIGNPHLVGEALLVLYRPSRKKKLFRTSEATILGRLN